MDILLLGVKDNLNHLGNLLQTDDTQSQSGKGERLAVRRRDSLRQHRLDEVLLQLLVDELELAECLLAPDDAVINGHSQVVKLRVQRKHVKIYVCHVCICAFP